MEGYIFKWVNFIKGWRPRYLILEENFIYFSKHKNDTKVKKIDLSSASVIDENKKKGFLIELDDKKIYIKTNTDEEKKAWFLKLIENKLFFKSKSTDQDPIFNRNTTRTMNFPLKKKDLQNNEVIERRKSKIEDLSVAHTKSYEIDNDNKSLKHIDDYLENNQINLNPTKNRNFSEVYKSNYKEINKNKYLITTKFDNVINNFQNIQNLFFEFNSEMESFNLLLMSSKIKNKDKDEFRKTYANLFNIKHEMKDQLDLSIKNLVEYKEEKESSHSKEQMTSTIAEEMSHNLDIIRPENETFYHAQEDYEDEIKNNLENENENIFKLTINSNSNQKEEIFFKYLDTEFNPEIDHEIENYNDNDSSFEDCIGLTEMNNTNYIDPKANNEFHASLEKSLLLESSENKLKFNRSLSWIQSDFIDPDYTFEFRIDLPAVIKCSSSMLSDMLKALTKEKIMLPIHYNEPISMLQKQCEKFQSSKLLSLAAKETSQCMKMCYIAGFLVSELSLNINRILKPFDPILGETFEYFDNNLKYRYFSEQVSHYPPISAFMCESEEFVVFGDTRCKHKFKILKRAMEINFTNKTNVMFKNTNEHFTYEKPTVYLKGLIMGTPHYDFSGVVNIVYVVDNNKKCKAVLDFFEEGRKSKPIGYFEGKVFDEDNKIRYLIQGNWNSFVNITDSEGNNPKQIWKINEESFIKNTDLMNNYLISKYANNLNYIPNENDLSKKLPPTDTRFRPDQRALEGRKMELAESEKIRVEQKQRNRHKKFEEEKIKYEPNYFVEVLDNKTNEYIYIYKGDYWSDRKKQNFKHLYNIFS